MHENDPHRDADPLWYDRTESDQPPGLILNGLAYLFLLAMAGFATAVQFYWLPDRAWRLASRWIKRRGTAGAERH